MGTFKKYYLFLERGEEREKAKVRNINVREKHGLIASRMGPDVGPDWGLNPQLSHVPRLGTGDLSLYRMTYTQPIELHWSGLGPVFVRTLIPFIRAPPSPSNHVPKALPLNTITLVIQFQNTDLGVRHKH